MKQLAIIADDLSSATDCGIQMARSGLPTLVALRELSPGADGEGIDILSLDTDSRSVSPGAAYARVKKVTQALLALGYHRFYKSIDSTLRGNLGAEVDAILNSAHFDGAVIAPAFPHYGRTTRQGLHCYNGIPIHRTEFARDPQSPVQDDNLVRLVGGQSVRKAGLVDLDTLRAGAESVEARLRQLIQGGVELFVFDAVEEPDLDRIVQTVSASGLQVLWVGSTGLARCIPAVLNIPAAPPPASRRCGTARPALLVIGSVSEVTRQQVQSCLDAGQTRPVAVDPYRIIAGPEDFASQVDGYAGQLRAALSGGGDAALFLASTRADVPQVQALGRERGLDNQGVAQRLVQALAEIVLQVAREDRVSGVVLSGGDTAKAFCDVLEARGIEILEEIEPGIPLCRLRGPYPLLMVTKAGAFGTPGVLIDSLEWVRRRA